MIDQFKGDYGFLSNFWKAPILFEGILYPTVEHAFQAAKTFDTEERQRIASLPTPGQAKRAGRKLQLRSDWNQARLQVMETLVREKFTRYDSLRTRLLETEDEPLVEGNTWNDRFWGVDLHTGIGENHLGQILMKVRAELSDQETKDLMGRYSRMVDLQGIDDGISPNKIP